jgi:hypothetical protein
VLRGHDYFPLYFDRLRKSKWWRRASDTARARNVMLWGEAYKAQPAGSLPDDDDELAEAAGYGMDVDAFLAVKDEILAPWILCADGRWYHPTTCEVVLGVWDKATSKRRDDAKRKRDQRDRARGVTAENGNVTCDMTSGARDEHTQTALSAVIEEKRVEDKKETTSPVASEASPKVHPWEKDPHFAELWGACTPDGRRRGKSREKTWPEWLKAKRRVEPEQIVAAMKRYVREDPDVKRTGGPGLHIWLRDGTYDQWMVAEQSAAAPPARSWSGPADLRAALVRAAPGGEAWVRGYIDGYSRFQEVPTKALLVSNAYARDQIEREVGRVLRERGIELCLAEQAA